MAENLTEIILENFGLNENQSKAAKQRGCDVVVTAGAGSGKTRTLVARYTCLLAEGLRPRQITAITFTNKAALQMRAKVRESLSDLEQQAANPEERRRWSELSEQIDSARIGTIHSLCAEILRNHPAEAGLDPRFEVLDESIAQVLKNRAVADTLNKLVEEERFIPLFDNLQLKDLKSLLQSLLGKRYEAQEIFELRVDNRKVITSELFKRINLPACKEVIDELRDLSYASIEEDCGNFAGFVQKFLENWTRAELSLAENEPVEAANWMNSAVSCLDFRCGKRGSEIKETLKEFRENFDRIFDPATKRKDTSPPTEESEQLFEALLPLLGEAFILVHQAYRDLLSKRQSLDFDDLEYGAYQLLKRDDIRSRWQQEIQAILVDEYQDTNQYQRDIINALAGKRGCLFIVGDMRQSIYRFRRADVTVFREESERIKREGGFPVDLDLTYRQHEPLLQTMADILAKAIGTEEDRNRSYYVPFTPMVANSADLPDHIKSPHIEVVLGAAADTDTARPVAARALASRLLELKAEGQIEKWDDVALLFHASTGFPFYEEAFEEAGIPFVTVAGRGFYNRPEIRDLVNILRALASSADDLAFAGLLRSPAFGLSDAALYHLHLSGLPFWEALQGDLSALSAEDQWAAQRARTILDQLLPLVDRVPVAELLKKVIDVLDYRAILATADTKATVGSASATGGRLWRNVDKLLEDTQTSQAVTVRDFLEMLSTLDDAGAREGEAPAEADGSVRLMTIHKAKGLEFPVVILADAGRENKPNSELVYLSKELGVTFKLDPAPMLYGLSKQLDKDQEECEALRVLYVALTRAQNKLIISSHVCVKDGKNGEKVNLLGWTQLLDDACGNLSEGFLEHVDEPIEANTISGHALRVYFARTLPEFEARSTKISQPEKVAEDDLTPLYEPVAGFGSLLEEEDDTDRLSEKRHWRVFEPDRELHGKPIGNLVHKALQRWLFPGDPALADLLEAETYKQDLVSDEQRQEASRRACELLDRFRHHPLWEEIDAARERYAELPYSFSATDGTQSRVIDLLYQGQDGSWQLVDFKTDAIHSLAKKEQLSYHYANQVRSYQRTAQTQLQQKVTARLCFLDDQGEVTVTRIEA
ncbi:MAG: UvrD-helicase domain-containing protein [Anaerolineaceae bacterium]